MKKLLCLLFFIPLFLFGCSWSLFDKKDVDSPNGTSLLDASENEALPLPEIVVISGYIQRNADRSLFEKGTHLLTNEGGSSEYFLSSKFEDLSQYIDEGKVEVKGERDIPDDESLPLLQVHTVHFLETPLSETSTVFTSSDLGISFILPPKWVYANAENGVTFFSDQAVDTRAFTLTSVSPDSEAGVSLLSQKESATQITLGNAVSYRLNTERGTTEIFTPLEKDILIFSFDGTEEEKVDLYDILLSVEFSAPPEEIFEQEVQICGGIAGFSCPIGYRCELEGVHPDASGVCVLAENPEVSQKGTLQPAREKAAADTQETPLPDAEETPSENEVSPDKQKTIQSITADLESLSPEKAPSSLQWKIASFGFSEGDLVSVEYYDPVDVSTKRKLLFEILEENGKIGLTQKAYFIPDQIADWKLESGENLQAGNSLELYDAEGEKKTDVSEGYRFYESTHHAFSLEYPKNYYYASLGKVNGTIATLAFSDEPVTGENVLIRVEVLDGEKPQRIESDTEIVLPRDQDSHFRISTQGSDLKSEISHMADTLSSSL